MPADDSQQRSSQKQRVLCAMFAFMLLAWLTLASALTPASGGMGTHRQLGLPPCGWIIAFNKPCPTCGMTTAFSHASHGQLLAAARVQPFALLLALGVSAGFWGCLYTAVSGSAVMGSYAFLLRPRWIWVMLGLLAISWGYKLVVALGAAPGVPVGISSFGGPSGG